MAMRERELSELLAGLDAEVLRAEPDPAFTDDLFARLQAEALRSRGWPRTMILLVAALLVAALAGAIAVGTGLLRDEAVDLVRRSQAVYQDPPPFTMVTTSGDPNDSFAAWYSACEDPSNPAAWRSVNWRYDYDGAGAFRQACLYGGPPPQYVGGFEVQTPEGHGVWDAASWSLLPLGFLNRPAGAPLVTPLWLNWLNPDGRLIECGSWQMGQIDEIAGRPAHVVSCGADRYWIDEASNLLVKREVNGVVTSEVIQLEIGTAPATSLFELHEAGFSTQFTVGEVPIEVTLPHVDAGEWHSASLQGRPAALYVQSDCHERQACLSLPDFVEVVSARSDSLNAAVVSYGHEEAFAEADVAAAADAGIPVVVDDQTGWPRWEYPGFGVALFEADGRFVAVVETRTRESLTAAIDALLNGAAIPAPPPGDGVFFEGEPAPPLVGSLIGGAAFDLEVLLGRPLVILVPPWLDPDTLSPECDPGLVEDGLRTLTEARAAVGDSAGFVAVAWGSPMGDTPQFAGWEELLEQIGSSPGDLTVVGPDPTKQTPWSWLHGPMDYCGGSTAAMAILDADGMVRHVIGDTLPSAEELVEMLRDL
jgi:hypothetical protein